MRSVPLLRHRQVLAVERLEGRNLPTFLPPVFYDGFPGVAATAIGDLNNDAVPDLVAVSARSAEHTVGVLLGNGDGFFQEPIYQGLGVAYNLVDLADFNGDGWLDVVVGRQVSALARLSVFLGNGDGSLQEAIEHVASTRMTALAVGDVNHDGTPDVVTSNRDVNMVSVHLGYGDGSLADGWNYSGRFPTVGVAIGDVNSDGYADLVTTTDFLLGNGDGTFQPAIPHSAPAHVVRTTDVNDDGITDLAFLCSGCQLFVVWVGNGDGTFTETTSQRLDRIPYWTLTEGDFNGDGFRDFATVDTGGVIRVFLGNGDGSFQRSGYHPVNNPVFLDAGDLNGDGFDDLAAAYTRDRVGVLLNDGAWGLAPGGGAGVPGQSADLLRSTLGDTPWPPFLPAPSQPGPAFSPPDGEIARPSANTDTLPQEDRSPSGKKRGAAPDILFAAFSWELQKGS